MNRLRIILGYILGFLSTSILAILIILVVLKITIYNKDFIKDTLNSSNYYDKVYNQILDNMKNYMISSGLPEIVLDDIYTKDMVINDVNLLVDNVYLGENSTFNIDSIKDKLLSNIDDYLVDHDVKITSKDYINSFVNDISQIYEKEVHLYGLLDGFAGFFVKCGRILNSAVVYFLIIFLMLFASLVLLNVKYLGSVLTASGLVVLFIRFVINEKIDFGNINVITSNFSLIFKEVFNNINYLVLLYSLIIVFLGLLLSYGKSFVKRAN